MSTIKLLCSRRWIALSAIALVLAVACGLLGRWQYTRTYRPADGYSQEPAAVPLGSVDSAMHPMTAALTNRQVLLTGTFDKSQQRLIAGHSLGGTPVLWVVTPLRLSDGSAIEVVRGWISQVDDALTAPPSEAVQVTGRIRPLDAAPTVETTLPPGESDAIDAALTQQLPYPVRTGYVVRTAQVPPDPLSLDPAPSQPPPAPPGAKQFYLQNGLYTIQWGLFALFVLFCWYRLFRSELATRTTATSTVRDNDLAIRTP